MNLKYIIIFSLLQAVAQAAPMDNGPYSPAARPPVVPLRELGFIKHTDDTGTYRSEDGQTEIQIVYKEFEGLYLELIRAGQVRVPKRLMCGGVFFGKGYQADLNQDGKPDYVFEYETGGNGLTPVYVVFLLSVGEGYTLTCTTSYFSESDFIFIQGKPHMICSDLGEVEQCADGKLHSFWVYNLLGFDKGEVKIDNSGVGVFPKIVWFSNAPNYRETTLLNSQQKADLIRRAQSGWREKQD